MGKKTFTELLGIKTATQIQSKKLERTVVKQVKGQRRVTALHREKAVLCRGRVTCTVPGHDGKSRAKFTMSKPKQKEQFDNKHYLGNTHAHTHWTKIEALSST